MNARWWLAPGLVVLLFVWPGSAVAQNKPFVWKEGKIEIQFPAEPKVEKDKLQLLQDGGILYLVTFNVIPGLENFSADQQKVIFDTTKDGLVKALKGELLNYLELKKDTYPGRELMVKTPATGVYRVQMFLVGERMYQVILLAPKDLVRGKEGEAFFKSFKLVK